jgi:hypothetical protein
VLGGNIWRRWPFLWAPRFLWVGMGGSLAIRPGWPLKERFTPVIAVVDGVGSLKVTTGVGTPVGANCGSSGKISHCGPSASNKSCKCYCLERNEST